MRPGAGQGYGGAPSSSSAALVSSAHLRSRSSGQSWERSERTSGLSVRRGGR